MTERSHPWIGYVQKIKAISQIGKTYTRDPFDMERYEQLEEIAHEMIALLVNMNIAAVDKCFLPESGYMTPKIDLRAGVFKEDRILLVRERSDGRWSLPGGWADVSESPSEGVVREVREESGFIVSNPRLVALIDRQHHEYVPVYMQHIYKAFFLCDYVEGEPVPNTEISEIGFFPLNELPELSTERVLEKDIVRLYEYYKGLNTSVCVD